MAALGVVWMVGVLYAVYPVLPFNPARLPLSETVETQFWVPEGWAFFTRNPREPRMLIYVEEGDGWQSALMGPHARASNLFGFNRASRAQGVEMGMLFTEVRQGPWQPCTGPIPECLDSLSPADTLVNISPRPTLCGVVGLAQQEPVPWAWSRSRKPITMPSEVIKLKVAC